MKPSSTQPPRSAARLKAILASKSFTDAVSSIDQRELNAVLEIPKWEAIWWVKAIDEEEQRKEPPRSSSTTTTDSVDKTKSREHDDESGDFLLARLEGVLRANDDSSTSPETHKQRVLEILRQFANTSDEGALQQALLDLLGFSDAAMELIAFVLEKRKAILKRYRDSASSKAASSKPHPSSNNNQIGRNAGTGVSFVKGAKIISGVMSSSTSLPSNSKREFRTHALLSSEKDGANRAAASRGGGGGTQTPPPSSSTTTTTTTMVRYENVFIPAPPRPSPQSSSTTSLIPVSQLKEKSRRAFEGIERLNRLQSELFEAAYNTSQNLLVCAPTGAGKTNVAMLTICREIERHPNIHHMKVIYVAPMKALAQEVVAKFSERLGGLRISVRELTGDMQLTRDEIENSHIIVTTPEKWDVITRKTGGGNEGTLIDSVKLLIIDEVHLVGEDRGPVIECLVGRTLRHVERSQRMIRVVGLSATLPNYRDVAAFLGVNQERGMFYFDATYRPVPLDQTFIGVQPPVSSNVNAEGKSSSAATTRAPPPPNAFKLRQQMEQAMNEIAFEHVTTAINEKQKQVMVFVHTRRDTLRTARAMLEIAALKHATIPPPPSSTFSQTSTKSSELRELLGKGVGIHHAGMSRADRSLVESSFVKGNISLLVCTATLAWGVNLPAHTVIIKGTQIYAPERGGACELESADVFQCFGRAGRPQYDTSGEAVLITEHAQLERYLRMLTNAMPLESKLIPRLPDAVNAEVASGTISNLGEAAEWLSYTFLNVRMIRNPGAYGISLQEREKDPTLFNHRLKLVGGACRELHAAGMIRVAQAAILPPAFRTAPEPSLAVGMTDLGRVASHFYVTHETVETVFNGMLKQGMGFGSLLKAVATAKEFDQLKVREEETNDLRRMRRDFCPIDFENPDDDDEEEGEEGEHDDDGRGARPSAVQDMSDSAAQSAREKACILLQACISRATTEIFTLVSDMNYVEQNAARVLRAAFEVALARGWGALALRTLQLCTSLERKCWWEPIQHALRQFAPALVPYESVFLLERARIFSEELKSGVGFNSGSSSRSAEEALLRRVPALNAPRAAKLLELNNEALPRARIELRGLQPVTRGMVRLTVGISPDFKWRERMHGSGISYWLLVMDGSWVLHSERITLRRGGSGEEVGVSSAIEISAVLPLFEEELAEGGGQYGYEVRVECDSGWLGCTSSLFVDLSRLTLPSRSSTTTTPITTMTELMNLDPLPIQALKRPLVESVVYRACSVRFFNPIQTQLFHLAYHTDRDFLVCAPQGSGKSVVGEIAMWRAWTGGNPEGGASSTVALVIPLGVAVRGKMNLWKERFTRLRRGAGTDVRGDEAQSWRVAELTPSAARDVEEEEEETRWDQADLLIGTPEAFDALLIRATSFASPNDEKEQRTIARAQAIISKISLVVVDSIHLLGEERGAAMELLISRLNLHGRGPHKRLVGLSTTLANAAEVGSWMSERNRESVAVFNFGASVRPVPLEVRLSGHAGKYHAERMAAMSKPLFNHVVHLAGGDHASEGKPVLVFACSRKQVKLTALDLISRVGGTDRPRRFLGFEIDEASISSVRDGDLRDALPFGIALSHPGMSRSDRAFAERAFVSGACRVMVCTPTAAWGPVDLPAHTVIIKGTETFDAAMHTFSTYPVTDVMRMMGLAGLRSGDAEFAGEAVVMVHDKTKEFYKRFLNEPFPLESALGVRRPSCWLDALLNAEIARGSVRGWDEASRVVFTSTFLARRIETNPSYYHSPAVVASGGEGERTPDAENLGESLVRDSLLHLHRAKCCELSSSSSGNGTVEDLLKDAKNLRITPTKLGETVGRAGITSETASFLVEALASLLPRSNRAVKREMALLQLQKQSSSSSSSTSPVSVDNDEATRAMRVLRILCETPDVLKAVPQRHREDEISRVIANEILPWGDRFFRTSSPAVAWGAPGIRPFALLQSSLTPSAAHALMRVPEYVSDMSELRDVMRRLFPVAIEAGIAVSGAFSNFTFPLILGIVNARRLVEGAERRRGDFNPATFCVFRDESNASVEVEILDASSYRVRINLPTEMQKRSHSSRRNYYVILVGVANARGGPTSATDATKQSETMSRDNQNKRKQDDALQSAESESLRVIGVGRTIEGARESSRGVVEARISVPDHENAGKRKTRVEPGEAVKVYVMDEFEFGGEFFVNGRVAM